MVKHRFATRLLTLSLAALTFAVMHPAPAAPLGEAGMSGYRNVIFMIPDGCSQSIQTLARWYKGEDLTLDSMNAGMVRTDMMNSVITGSAAAATAFSSGHKTTVRFLGVAPREEDMLSIYDPDDFDDERQYAPLATILEAANQAGKATGLVATSRITHATPAAFACHIRDRGMDNEIMEHMVYNGLTVALGGGRRHLLPDPGCDSGIEGGKRTDCENLEQVLVDRGYEVVTSATALGQLDMASVDKLWGAFDMSHMAPDIDRVYYGMDQPSLAEMTETAIQILNKDEDGFFLMVEGSQVDWAGHNNDPVYMVTDFIAFDDAVRVAVEFAKQDGDTLILAFPDHNTGGMKIGQYDAGPAYTDTTVEDLADPLLGMKVTANSLVAEMDGDYTEASMKASIKALWGIDATEADIAEINALAPSVGLSYALARVISKNHTVIGWTTHGHNGEEVPVWIYPPSESVGVIDNTDLPILGQAGDLDALTEALYVDIDDRFPNQWIIDKTDPANPVLVVRGKVEMPISKDYAIYDGAQFDLGSLVVDAPLFGEQEHRVFVPETAIDLVRQCTGDRGARWRWGR
jgi:alkaline phosphatase